MAHEVIPNEQTNWEQCKRRALKNLGTFIRAHFTRCLILWGLLVAVGHAQQPSTANPSSSSATSVSAQAKNVPAASDRVVLKVGNTKVTEEEFESRIEGIEPHGGDPDKEGATEKDRRRLGDDYASVLMLSQQALANGLASSPEVVRKLAIARMQVLSDAEFASLMHQAEPSSEEIRQYYSAHLSDYDEVQIRRLFIWKVRDKSKDEHVLSSQAAKARADQIRHQCASGASEKTVAANLIKSGDGMLDPEPLIFLRGQLSPAIEKVAFALKEGEWSEVEDNPSRLMLIQLVKRDRQTLGQVSSHIEKDLQGQKMQALLDNMKAKAGIWMDEQFFGTAMPDPQSEPQKTAKKAESNNGEQQK
jgi:parvulin-like peptidyl-prolyl isomerase